MNSNIFSFLLFNCSIGFEFTIYNLLSQQQRNDNGAYKTSKAVKADNDNDLREMNLDDDVDSFAI